MVKPRLRDVTNVWQKTFFALASDLKCSRRCWRAANCRLVGDSVAYAGDDGSGDAGVGEDRGTRSLSSRVDDPRRSTRFPIRWTPRARRDLRFTGLEPSAIVEMVF